MDIRAVMALNNIIFSTYESVKTAFDFSFLSSKQPDRRQESRKVALDRRSGIDRRSVPRFSMDSKLCCDIQNVKDTYNSVIPKTSFFIDEINRRDTFVKQNKSNPDNVAIEGVIDAIPLARRIIAIKNNKDNDNHIKAIGLGLIALINVIEDLRDLLSFFGKSRSQAPEGYYSVYRFFAGIPIENWLSKREWGQKILVNWDTTLVGTKYKENIYNFFNVKEDRQFFEKETKIPFVGTENILREYIKLEGPFVSRLACLSMNRITKIGLIVMSVLELSPIFKAIKNKKDFSQIPKSAINVISSTICGAALSAAASLIFGVPAASVIGLGLGIFIGNRIAKLINQAK